MSLTAVFPAGRKQAKVQLPACLLLVSATEAVQQRERVAVSIGQAVSQGGTGVLLTDELSSGVPACACAQFHNLAEQWACSCAQQGGPRMIYTKECKEPSFHGGGQSTCMPVGQVVPRYMMQRCCCMRCCAAAQRCWCRTASTLQ